jgi:hypothetical protein
MVYSCTREERAAGDDPRQGSMTMSPKGYSGDRIRKRHIEQFLQLLIAERLAEKADSPGIERMVACPLIRKRRDKNDRRAPALRDQDLLELDPAQALHLNVENETTGIIQIGIQKLFRRGKDAGVVTERPHQRLRGFPDGFIIVNNRDHWSFRQFLFPGANSTLSRAIRGSFC